MHETLREQDKRIRESHADIPAMPGVSADPPRDPMPGAIPVPVTDGATNPARPRRWHYHLPPPYPPPTGCQRVCLPFYGFVLDADDDHCARVDRFFQVPMLVLSLLVLPILIAQYYFRHRLNHPWVPYLLEAAFLAVSIAFLVEFVVKISVARSRWRYALANWLDIVIIILPFLRPFRAARILRVAQLLPAYSLRGVYGKLIRSGSAVIIGMTLVQRLRTRLARGEPPAQAPPDYAQWSKAALIAEIHRLEEELRELRRKKV